MTTQWTEKIVARAEYTRGNETITLTLDRLTCTDPTALPPGKPATKWQVSQTWWHRDSRVWKILNDNTTRFDHEQEARAYGNHLHHHLTAHGWQRVHP